MTRCQIVELAVGDVVFLPVTAAGDIYGPITIERMSYERDGTVCVGWHTAGEDHLLYLPQRLAALGAELVSSAASCSCSSIRLAS